MVQIHLKLICMHRKELLRNTIRLQDCRVQYRRITARSCYWPARGVVVITSVSVELSVVLNCCVGRSTFPWTVVGDSIGPGRPQLPFGPLWRSRRNSEFSSKADNGTPFRKQKTNKQKKQKNNKIWFDSWLRENTRISVPARTVAGGWPQPVAKRQQPSCWKSSCEIGTANVFNYAFLRDFIARRKQGCRSVAQ